MNILFNIRDRCLLTVLRCLPPKLASHLLFVLSSNRSLADRWGYHIRPIHYYDPLPDFREITPARATRRREPLDIDFNLAGQIALIQRLASLYRGELETLAATPDPGGFNFSNDYFTGVDAAVYYALIRDLKPTRVIEVGSGYSTRMADHALRRNRAEGRGGELICIEPYPQPRLTGARLEMTLVQQRVEEVDPDLFAALEPGDILFIDSSHVVKFGNDVWHEFLEILPRLKPGVWIHVHDIFFPYDYPAEWLIEKRIAFNEQYLLEAFLSGNDRFEIMVTNHWLCLDYFPCIATLCPQNSLPTGPLGRGSFWMKKTK
jgi:hypothetical protein